jgi:hypothetical protein
MAKKSIAASIGVAVAHGPRPRHGTTGGEKPAAKYRDMIAAAERVAKEEITDPAQARQMILDARAKHRKAV